MLFLYKSVQRARRERQFVQESNIIDTSRRTKVYSASPYVSLRSSATILEISRQKNIFVNRFLFTFHQSTISCETLFELFFVILLLNIVSKFVTELEILIIHPHVTNSNNYIKKIIESYTLLENDAIPEVARIARSRRSLDSNNTCYTIMNLR